MSEVPREGLFFAKVIDFPKFHKECEMSSLKPCWNADRLWGFPIFLKDMNK